MIIVLNAKGIRILIKLFWSMIILLPILLCSPSYAVQVRYSYDENNQLITASYDNGVVIEYFYDAAGNRISQKTVHSPDTDSDGIYDNFDPDDDNDGLCDPGESGPSCTGSDNCRLQSNPGQEDADSDGVGDLCDNCPTTSNPDQADADNEGIGDVCDTCTDADADGYGRAGLNNSGCSHPEYDCNDNDASIHPGATETCDNIDSNCNGMGDEPYTTYYRDLDGDTYGNPANSIKACSLPEGNVLNNTDCNDSDPNTHPGGTEVCVGGADEDCDGATDCSDSDCENDVACKPGYVSSLPDTGQTKCYDDTHEITCPQPGQPFYGQDAQYGSNLQSFTDLGNGIVRDNITGLEWQQATAPGTYTWQQAIDYCNNLSLGGHSDWRLPTIKELSTLFDSSRQNPEPRINTNYFPDTPVEGYGAYWSSTTAFENPECAWGLYFQWGQVYYNNASSTKTYVRAVREGNPALFENLFVDNNNNTVTDTSTGLMWQQSTAPATYTWEQALSYCENLNLGGYSDWRLPNRNELQSLVDYNRYNPAIDINVFPDSQTAHYWSSTTMAGNPQSMWFVNFYNGHMGSYNKNSGYYVRAVRGGQCGSLGDLDGDDVCNNVDNCPFISNPGQEDTDNDGVGNACDNCPGVANTNQADNDEDSIGDACDPDDDNDGLLDAADNCPYIGNLDQADTDEDGIGNVCDNCILTPNGPDNGTCWKGFIGAHCKADSNCGPGGDCSLNQEDSDADGTGDACDGCMDMDGDGYGSPGFPSNICPNDNCPIHANGPTRGTCAKNVSGVLIGTGVTCTNGSMCASGQVCQMSQEDMNSNTIGDACECYADCNHDGKVILSDLVIMKTEFGRTNCATVPCQADANGDGKVILSDLVIMKTEFGKTGCPVP